MTWRGYSAFVGSAARVMRAECSRSSTVGLFGQSWWVFSKTQGQSANLSHSQYLVLSILPARAKREEKKRILKERAFSEMLVKLSTRYSRSPPAGEQEPRANSSESAPGSNPRPQAAIRGSRFAQALTPALTPRGVRAPGACRSAGCGPS